MRVAALFFENERRQVMEIKSEEIEYHERKGVIWFSYYKEVPVSANSSQVYETSGKIPSEVQKQGKEAVRKYAEQKVKQRIATQERKNHKQGEFEKNPNYPVETTFKGKLLKGRIISAEDSTLTVRLEKPYQGEQDVHFGWAAAMHKKYIFDGKGSFSSDALDSAQELLVDIYQKQCRKRSKTGKLVSKLNNGKEVYLPLDWEEN